MLTKNENVNKKLKFFQNIPKNSKNDDPLLTGKLYKL